MKLVEILARELKEWPVGIEWIRQTGSGNVVLSNGIHSQEVFQLGQDQKHAEVTRAQWEAERARIASQSVSMSDEDVAFVKSDFYRDMVDRKIEQDLAAIACGKRSKEDQELWDDVAKIRYSVNLDEIMQDGIYTAEDARSLAAQIAFSESDAFMAERAKRMK